MSHETGTRRELRLEGDDFRTLHPARGVRGCRHAQLLVTPAGTVRRSRDRVLFASGSARARELYVDPTTGNDAAAGSKAAPWKTIGKAAGAAVAGDTVHVAPGIYPEIITSSASGTAAAPIVFVSDAPWKAQIVGPAHVTGGPVSVWTAGGDHVDIIGFDITGGPRVGILVNGSYVRTIGNHVHDIKADWDPGNGGAGIDDGNYSAHDDDMIGNVVHDIGPSTASTSVHGLYHSNLRGRIVNNITYRNAGWGIHTWHNPKDVLIANNLVFENRSGGIIVGAGDSPGTGVADGFLVENNIVIKNYARAGIIEYGAYGPDNRYVNNLVWANPAGAFAVVPATKISGTIDLDPAFVKYDGIGNTGDYHLLRGSPAIDRGASSMAPTDDIEGVPRPQGPAWDIGPYEWRLLVADAGPVDAAGPDAGVDATSDTLGGADASGDTGADTGADTGVDTMLDAVPARDTGGTDGAVDDVSVPGAAGCGCSVPRSEAPPRLGLLAIAAALLCARRRTRSRAAAATSPTSGSPRPHGATFVQHRGSRRALSS
jgi:hypothetical protein